MVVDASPPPGGVGALEGGGGGGGGGAGRPALRDARTSMPAPPTV